RVKFIGFTGARGENIVEIRSERAFGRFGFAEQAQANCAGSAPRNLQDVVWRCLGADPVRVGGLVAAANDVFVECVLHEGAGVAGAPQTPRIGFVLGEQDRRLSPVRARSDRQTKIAQRFVRGLEQILVFVAANARL